MAVHAGSGPAPRPRRPGVPEPGHVPRRRERLRQGFFLRAETAFGVFNFMSDHSVAGYGDRHLDTVSHGEGFMQVICATHSPVLAAFPGATIYQLNDDGIRPVPWREL